MALWKILTLNAALIVLTPQCYATNKWLEDYFRELERAESNPTSQSWREEYYSEDDSWEWDDPTAAPGELSG